MPGTDPPAALEALSGETLWNRSRPVRLHRKRLSVSAPFICKITVFFPLYKPKPRQTTVFKNRNSDPESRASMRKLRFSPHTSSNFCEHGGVRLTYALCTGTAGKEWRRPRWIRSIRKRMPRSVKTFGFCHPFDVGGYYRIVTRAVGIKMEQKARRFDDELRGGFDG